MLMLAAGVSITFIASVGWESLKQPAGSADALNRNGSFMGGIEQITDSLLHLLDSGAFGKGDKNTAKSGDTRSSRLRRP